MLSIQNNNFCQVDDIQQRLEGDGAEAIVRSVLHNGYYQNYRRMKDESQTTIDESQKKTEKSHSTADELQTTSDKSRIVYRWLYLSHIWVASK